MEKELNNTTFFNPYCSSLPVLMQRVFLTLVSDLCISSIAERQGMKRGWFTYTDLCVLLEQAAWSNTLTAIYQHFTKVRRRLQLKGAERT